ncbi:MAG: exodeoxyribonuclease V subunit alpha [Halomonas sp.]|nr:exodeoxyribonuclease V subunit alpha [Halomonas sp.]MDN6297620.1 exodeoxyribonuclease V subunit alpha [Halomonas sp.]MDN6314845.1 exodeoxyribonuclease V subunit alpha [Halomonas sp.]MDN6335818.1 exodeoxyribonuclease V subunit alpha [Halomonas sp.]
MSDLPLTPDLFAQAPPAVPEPHPALSDSRALHALLERWVERGWLRDLDRALVRFLDAETDAAPPLVLLAAALASHQLGHGHVCLDLAATLERPDGVLSLPPEGDVMSDPPPLPGEVLATLTLERWRAALEHPALVGTGPGSTPLVRDDRAPTTRLYLRRYWEYEQTLHTDISRRLASSAPAQDAALTRATLDTLFGAPDAHTFDWQKAACALAAPSPFAVITGGPGTGKTTTVVRLLALLQTLQQAEDDAPPLEIRLAAPTGKAAARLGESITGQVTQLPISQALKSTVPTEVTTLHRLLGARPDTRHFRHHADNPLSLDVLVIDEASMVDIEMLTAVLSALPAHARLVLLGDKDQLASVEAGSILGDLCRRADAGHYTPATARWLSRATGQPLPDAYVDPDGQPQDQAIAMLRQSYRFDAQSGIGQLARAVNRSAQDEVRAVLGHGYADLHHLVLDSENDPALKSLALNGATADALSAGVSGTHPPAGYRHYLSVLNSQRPPGAFEFMQHLDAYSIWASAVLEAYGRFQLLCALRKGPWGIEGLNLRVGKVLRQARLIEANDAVLEHGWFEGRPVLVTQNDYGLKLMNGDIGVALNVVEAGRTRLRVAFPGGDPETPIRWVLPSRLHAVETVFAMTVHKSQGSEFHHAAVLLPDRPSPVLTRELVYTGLTRARQWLTLIEARRGILDQAVTRQVLRASGLG